MLKFLLLTSLFFTDLGGVDYAKDIANSQINTALNLLNSVPDSKFKRLLSSWAEFMLNRSL